MGKIVQVKAGFQAVALPPSNLPFNGGQSTTLTDAEYAGLAAATSRCITVTTSGVPDPVRSGTNSPQSYAETLALAKSYSDNSLVDAPYVHSKSGSIFSIGDSISLNGTLQGSGTSDTLSGTVIFGNLSWLGWALPLTNGRFRFGGLAATHGFTSAQVLATELPFALASSCDYVVVLAGTNDNGVATLAVSQANLMSMYTQIVAKGKTPILCTIPPQDTAGNTGAGLTFITSLNLWIKKTAAARRWPLVDFHSVLVNPALNTYTAGLGNADGVHPVSTGAKLMGIALAATLNAIPQGMLHSPLWDSYNPNLILPDCAMTSALSDKWATAGSTTGVILNFPASVSAFKGTSWQVGRGSVGDLSFVGPIAAGKFIAGHRVRVAFLFDATRIVTTGTWTIGLYDNTAVGFITGFQGMDQVLNNGSVLVTDGVIAAGTLNIVTSASKLFRQSHVGMAITATSTAFAQVIPNGTTIIGVAPDGSQAYLSVNGTAGTALNVWVIAPYLTSVFEFVVPAGIVGHTIDFRYVAQGTQGTAIAGAQVTVADLTALGVAA